MRKIHNFQLVRAQFSINIPRYKRDEWKLRINYMVKIDYILSIARIIL